MSEPSSAEAALVGPKAWAAIEDKPGWFLLMDAQRAYETPRPILSDQDLFFVRESAKAFFPKDKFRVIEIDKKKFLARITSETETIYVALRRVTE